MKGPRRKRLNVTILVSSLTIGGAEQLLLDLLKNIDRKRFDLSLCFLRGPGIIGSEILQLGIPSRTHILRSKFDVGGVFRLAAEFRRRKTEVLFLINHLNTLFYGVMAAKLAGVPRIVNWQNETYKRYPCHRWTMLGRRLVHLFVHEVIAAAQGHRDYIAGVEKIPARKITAIYNGVDPARFQPTLSKEAAREHLEIPPHSPVVGILAALRPDKAHDIFLESVRLVLQSMPGVHFVIVGDGPERAKLERLAKGLKISGSVHFLGFRRDLPLIFSAMDLKVLSSRPEQETLSVAAIEAMSAGIPVVCTRVGFMSEIVKPGRTGYLAKVGDPRDLADNMIRVLGSDEIHGRMRKETRRLVAQKLTVAEMVSRFEDVLMENN